MADTTFAFIEHDEAGRGLASPPAADALEDVSAWEAYPHVSPHARVVTIAGLSVGLLALVGGTAALVAQPHVPLWLKVAVVSVWGANVLVATGLRNGRSG